RRTLALPCAALPAPGESVPCQAGFMSIAWVRLNVIGPVRPGVVPPAAMFRVMVASTVAVEWVLSRRGALDAIHAVASEVAVPLALAALPGRMAVTNPPSVPDSPGREPLPKLPPFPLPIRPAEPTFISAVVAVVVVVLVVPLVVVLTVRSVRSTVRSAVPLES